MRSLAALVLVLTLSAAAEAQDGGGRLFGSWTAACDPSGFCSATASQGSDYIFKVARHAEQSYWELQFRATGPSVPDQWSEFTVSVDGDFLTFSPQSQVGAYGTDRDFYFLGDPAQSLMDKMMPGNTLSVAFTDSAPSAQSSEFSLEGLTAALIWIDEQQGRIGSERVAAAPPYGLVPVYAGETTPDVPLALLDRHRADPDCQPFEDLANGRDFVVDELSGGYTVYLLPCQSGAYNFAQKVYVGSGGDYFDPQFFADYQTGIGWTGTPYLWNADYDRETDTVYTFAKARGIGDCGSQANWQWNGYLFQLMEMRARACTDDIDPNAEMPEFPVVYTGEPIAAATP